jgi:hypothetical protein
MVFPYPRRSLQTTEEKARLAVRAAVKRAEYFTQPHGRRAPLTYNISSAKRAPAKRDQFGFDRVWTDV